jgi:prepilin-type N-terminal cleavage/methylation domain-containing protein
MKTTTNTKGFTLIELLVVIAIIGVLSTVVLSSLNTARGRARDARRLSDIRTIQTALEVYANDNGGRYPDMNANSHNDSWASLETALGVTLPRDPLYTSNTGFSSDFFEAAFGNYVYSYFANNHFDICFAKAYALGFNLEGKNGDGANDGVLFCRALSEPLIYTFGNTFIVGMDANGRLKTPDLSGTAK